MGYAPTCEIDRIHRLLEAYKTARTARAMSDLYEEHARLTAKYVHACSRGHEVIQIAADASCNRRIT